MSPQPEGMFRANREDGHRRLRTGVSGPLRPWNQSQEAGGHFGCGAEAPPEVPGGGTTFGSPTWGTGFSMAGSTSFGWMTPFDWFSFSLRFWAGAVSRGARLEMAAGWCLGECRAGDERDPSDQQAKS